jgi:nucleotide-binding universal stress UspA family protein
MGRSPLVAGVGRVHTPVVTGRRIVVGVDGSLSSREALRWAAHIVRMTGDHIVAVHALGLADPDAGRDDLAERRWHAETAEVLELDWCRELVRARIPFSAVVRRGHPLDVIPAAAEQHRASLVVVGNRGAGSAPTLGMGRTSRRMLRLGRQPVLVTPEPGVGTQHLALRRIMVAVDGSTASERALDAATQLAAAFGSRVTLLRALEDDDRSTQPRIDSRLPLLARRLSDQGVPVQTMVRRGDPVDVVQEAADSLDPDLLAVGAGGRDEPTPLPVPLPPLPRLGSVIRSVVRGTHRATLVVPTGGPADATFGLRSASWCLPAGR